MCGVRDKAHKGVLTAGKQNCLVTHLKKRNNNNSSNNTKTEIDRNDLQGSFPSKQLRLLSIFLHVPAIHRTARRWWVSSPLWSYNT